MRRPASVFSAPYSGNDLNCAFTRDRGEVTNVEGCYPAAIALGARNHRSISIAKCKFSWASDHLKNPLHIGVDKFHHECACGNVPEEFIEPSRSEPCLEEVTDLREYSSRDDERQ